MKKKTIEDARKMFADVGYELLEDTYLNYMTKMRYRCPNHPDEELSMNLNNLKAGHRCPLCAGRKRHTTKSVSKEFAERGYTLLDEYKNNRVKMKYKCHRHPNKEMSISYSNFQKGSGCYWCGLEKHPILKGGEENPNWKGGVTEINFYLRQAISDWKKLSLANANYRCFITEVHSDKLHIHHTKPYHEIRDEVLNELRLPLHKHIGDYTKEQLKSIYDLFYKKHMDIEGVPMLQEIHKEFHEMYGFNASTHDLLDFKYRVHGKLDGVS